MPTSEPAPAPTHQQEPRPRLAVSVQQQRPDEGTRTVGVDTTNRTTAPVHVSAVRLSGGGLDGPTTRLDTDLQPGLTVALRTPYGRPRCDDRDDAVTAHLRIDGRTLTYPVDAEGQAEVRRLLDYACQAITLARTADVRLAGPYRVVVADERPMLRGRLVVDRRSPTGSVDVRSLDGSVLLDLVALRPLADLPLGADRAATPILLGSSGRCDAHALGGSTQTFLLSAFVRLDKAPEQRVILTPPRPVQGRVLELVDRACATVVE
jgi:hypothetical protein